ncbi:MAG: pyrroline-5-carboxylate reductase [Lachnospiraceae bacterium]|nr:pyrroline-5-carboxylate reductase [Robinsoniella sp.]MDY3767338.1 pyrroline-5-carboxylate reductase [Lachnospiraceae bacterium]
MKVGFIGGGNMASAMIGGILNQKIVCADEVIASTKTEKSRQRVEEMYHIRTTLDNIEVAQHCDILVLAVKPKFYAEVIRQIKDVVTDAQIVVSIAPGKTLGWLEGLFEKPVKIVRCMPNTPALVGEGMTGVCSNGLVTEQEMKTICMILEGCGKVEIVEESLMDAVVSVSGSSPAYVFLFIEAMADAAVADGMPRAQAYRMAAQAVLGSAKMVLETGKHPGELKDMVCSPGGTTIEAVRVLEAKGMRSAVMEAMKACTEKAKGC